MVLSASILFLLSLISPLLAALAGASCYFHSYPQLLPVCVSTYLCLRRQSGYSPLTAGELSRSGDKGNPARSSCPYAETHLWPYISCVAAQRSWKRRGTNLEEVSRKPSGKTNACLACSADKMQTLAFLRLMRWLNRGRLHQGCQEHVPDTSAALYFSGCSEAWEPQASKDVSPWGKQCIFLLLVLRNSRTT